jgi:predicted nucleic acid-binding protein
MSRYVLDSYAVLVYMQREPGWERVKELLVGTAARQVELYMSVINLVEVKYRVARVSKNRHLDFGAIDALPITRLSADQYVDRVIDLKADYPVPLADCFAAAAAMERNCPVVTGDPEFKRFQGIVEVEWLQ